jgi:hypothetical protein
LKKAFILGIDFSKKFVCETAEDGRRLTRRLQRLNEGHEHDPSIT